MIETTKKYYYIFKPQFTNTKGERLEDIITDLILDSQLYCLVLSMIIVS